MLKKLRFLEPGNYSPFQSSIVNAFTYNKFIKNPSTGLITLATIARRLVRDTLMYSESISVIHFDDVYDADIVFLSINTFNAVRGYAVARQIRAHSKALIVFGGMHASLNHPETIEHCDYVLTGDADESIVEFIQAIEKGEKPRFPGVVYKEDGVMKNTGKRPQPEDIDTIPDRSLVFDYARLAKRYDTLWPQVHASRGCPHHCAYCTVIHHFGQRIRKRSPASVVADIKEAIAFHRRPIIPRLNTVLWITDDNFAQDREWAISVLKEIIRSDIRYHFTVQARYEVGFDDEVLSLMKQAGFFELALGIEFLKDETFKTYGKRCTSSEIVRSIKNIRAHGIGVRGLFVVGSEQDTPGVGDDIARFVKENGIHGALIQSLFFTPGTPFFEEHKDLLIHQDWDKYNGNVVHRPKNIQPHVLQMEIIRASREIYSPEHLASALLHYPWINKVLFFGEFFWQRSFRKDLADELEALRGLPRSVGSAPGCSGPG